MLEELIRQESALKSQLVDVRRRIHDEQLRQAKETFGVEIGSVVIGKDGGKEYRVVEIQLAGYRDRPWVSANPRRKDGTFGTAVRNLYDDWTVKG